MKTLSYCKQAYKKAKTLKTKKRIFNFVMLNMSSEDCKKWNKFITELFANQKTE